MTTNTKFVPGRDSEEREPQHWFERAAANRLQPRDDTLASQNAAPLPDLAAALSAEFARNGVATINLANTRISDPIARATLRLAALRLGMHPDGVSVIFDYGTSTMQMTRRH